MGVSHAGRQPPICGILTPAESIAERGDTTLLWSWPGIRTSLRNGLCTSAPTPPTVIRNIDGAGRIDIQKHVLVPVGAVRRRRASPGSTALTAVPRRISFARRHPLPPAGFSPPLLP